MKEIGIVFENRGKEALVSIQRHAACGDCGACHIGQKKATMETLARNPIKAQVGETVEVEMEFVSIFKAAFIAYGIPLLVFLMGSVATYLMVDIFKLSFDQVLTSFFSGIILIILSYFVIQQFDKKGIFRGKYMPIITTITTPIDCETSIQEKMLGH